ncbi:hypothetical protein ACUXK4_004519 [Methylorubrum extorquens]
MAMKDISDREVLLAYMMAWCERVGGGESRWPYDILAGWTGQPVKVCWRCVERASDRGLLGCGVSLRTGWIERRGYDMLGVPAPANVYARDGGGKDTREILALYKRLLTEAGRPVVVAASKPQREARHIYAILDPFVASAIRSAMHDIEGGGRL